MDEKKIPCCSFCGKTKADVKTLVASPESNCFICEDCIDTCKKMMSESTA